MCYSVAEAEFLTDQGCDDFLVAYPHVQCDDARRAGKLSERGKTITLMIDSLAHADRLARFCREQNHSSQLRVCIDVDASLEKFGQHFGAQRSPVRSIDRLSELIRVVKQYSELTLVGAMTYEPKLPEWPILVPPTTDQPGGPLDESGVDGLAGGVPAPDSCSIC